MDPEDQAALLQTGCMAVFPRYIVENAILLTLDVPDVPCPSGPLQTNILDINPAGDFVRIYIGSGGFRHDSCN